jgi:hypothetical protein
MNLGRRTAGGGCPHTVHLPRGVLSHGHAGHAGDGVERHLHNPIEDKLIPLEPLDLGKVKSIDDLVRATGEGRPDDKSSA